MNRIVLAALALTATTGCADFDFSDINIDWGTVSTGDGMLYTPTNGVVIHENGRDAHVGMHDTTCEVDTDGAWIGTDHDIAGSDEMVVDTKTDAGGDRVLVTTDRGVHVVTKDDFWGDQELEHAVPGTIDAAFGGDETIVAIADQGSTGCAVNWVDEGTGAVDSIAIPGDYCGPEADFAVDRSTNEAWVITPHAGLINVSPQGVATVGEAIGVDGNDIVVFDDFSNLVYVASTGGSDVTAMSPEGDTVWTTSTGGSIISIEDAGVRQGAIVLIRTNMGNDQVLYLDADTGSANIELDTPQGSTDIAVSDNGYNIALVSDDDVYFTSL